MNKPTPNLEGTTEALGGIAELTKAIGNIVRPIYYAYFVIVQLVAITKSFVRVRDSEGKIKPSLRKQNSKTRKIDTGIKLTVAVLLITFATLSIAFPPLFYVFAMVTYVIGFVHEIKNLAKAIAKQKAYKEKVAELRQESFDPKTDITRRKEILAIVEKYEAVIAIGKYKSIQRGVDLAIASFSVIGGIVILTTGPIGLAVVAAGLVVCFTIKLCVYLHQRKHLSADAKQLARELRKEDDGEELDKTFDNYLYKKLKGENRVSVEKETDGDFGYGNKYNDDLYSDCIPVNSNTSRHRYSDEKNDKSTSHEDISPELANIKEPEPSRNLWKNSGFFHFSKSLSLNDEIETHDSIFTIAHFTID